MRARNYKQDDDEFEEEDGHHGAAQDESFEDKISSKLAGVKTPTSNQSKAPPMKVVSKPSSKNDSQVNKLAASSGSEQSKKFLAQSKQAPSQSSRYGKQATNHEEEEEEEDEDEEDNQSSHVQ